MFDLKQLKVSSRRPYPNMREVQQSNIASNNCSQDGSFVCKIKQLDGSICGRTFNTFKALHQQQQAKSDPNHPSIAHIGLPSFIKSNMCIFCETCLSSKQACVVHVKGALMRGHCRANMNIFKNELEIYGQLKCP
eukprot:7596772-Karenia_brevis.AAC.1